LGGRAVTPAQNPDAERPASTLWLRKGDDPWSTLRSALNGAQDLFTNRDGLWCWTEQTRAVGTELSGRVLSDAILVHVQGAYPRDRVFHYEVAKEQMLAKGQSVLTVRPV